MNRTDQPSTLRFIPTHVEELPDVTEGAFFSDRIELLSEGRWVTLRFRDMLLSSDWPVYVLDAIGIRLGLSVGHRDWGSLSFNSDPPIRIGVPRETDAGGFDLMERVLQVIQFNGYRIAE